MLKKHVSVAEVFPIFLAAIIILSTLEGLTALSITMQLPARVRGLLLQKA